MWTQTNDFHPINLFYSIYLDIYEIYDTEMTQQTLSTKLRICLHAVEMQHVQCVKTQTNGMTEMTFTLNTSEKKPEPIFSQIKSSIRARLDTALRSAR